MIPAASDVAVFVGASLLLLGTPGPAVLYIVARSVEQGRAAGLVSALGLAAGGVLHVAATVLGVAALVAASPLAYEAVRYLGAGYLAYLGLRQLAAGRDPEPGDGGPPASWRRIFVQGILVSVLNPKAIVFFVAFLPQFTDPGRGPVAGQLLTLGLIFLALALITDSTYALLAGAARARIAARPSFGLAARRLAGCVYLGLALATALAAATG